MTRDAQTWIDYSEALAFVGNSLLSPMNQTGTIGLEPGFWAEFPDFGNALVATALEALGAYAEAAQQVAADGGDPVQDASVEYTKLFVGPPRPAAAPWETMYRGGAEAVTVGFGQATFEMRGLLREAGLEVSNENNQYADHAGIELLYASVLCQRAAEAADAQQDADAQQAGDAPGVLAETEGKLAAFANERVGTWFPKLRDAIDTAAPDGYFTRLVDLAIALVGAVAA